ncbi:MAG: hypothetical protein ACRDUW_06555 [Pseudonocardiaceae bacterium]
MTTKTDATEPNWVESHAGAPEKWEAGQVGDALIGTYVGFEEIEILDPERGPQTIRYYDIRDRDNHLWSVPNSYQIEKGFAGVEIGSLVKLTYLGTIDLGKKGHNPMKNYSLHVAGK